MIIDESEAQTTYFAWKPRAYYVIVSVNILVDRYKLMFLFHIYNTTQCLGTHFTHDLSRCW